MAWIVKADKKNDSIIKVCMKRLVCIMMMLISAVCYTACSISYQLNGASIDYTTTHTISFEYIPIKASLVYAPLAVTFNDKLQQRYVNQTRLSQVDKDGDLQISGAITGYSLSNGPVDKDSFASSTRLTIKVKIKFVNKNNKSENFEKEFSQFADFPSSQMLNDVQDDLCEELSEKLVDEIFNATVANW